MKKIILFIKITIIACVTLFILYAIIGTSNHVDKIKQIAPTEFAKRNWTILRYEGFEYGSFNHHGGKVWYHVCNTNNPNIQYRVFVTMWHGELQYYYGQPELLNRIEVNTKELIK